MLLTLQVGSKALTLRGEEAGRFCEVTGVSIVDAGGSRVRSRHFNGRQAKWHRSIQIISIFRLRDEFSSGVGLCAG